jgi:hypothetical protein
MPDTGCPFCSPDPDAIADYYVEIGDGTDKDELIRRLCGQHKEVAYRVGQTIVAVLNKTIAKLGRDNDGTESKV